MDDFKARLEAEQIELSEKLDRLEVFITGQRFSSIDDVQQALLKTQADAMKTYLTCLSERLVRL